VSYPAKIIYFIQVPSFSFGEFYTNESLKFFRSYSRFPLQSCLGKSFFPTQVKELPPVALSFREKIDFPKQGFPLQSGLLSELVDADCAD